MYGTCVWHVYGTRVWHVYSTFISYNIRLLPHALWYSSLRHVDQYADEITLLRVVEAREEAKRRYKSKACCNPTFLLVSMREMFA